jgi:hypothetical protein
MSQLPTLSQTLKTQVLSSYSLIIISIISFIYFSISVFLLNYRLVLSSIFGEYPLDFKFNILFQLLIGSYSAFSFLDFVLLIITSILVGINILLIYRIIISLKTPGVKLSFTVGGSTILGVLVAGCSSCGFSVLSLLGIAGALSFIPFQAIGLHLIAITLLIFSWIYSLKTYHNKIVCKIN